MTGTIILSAKQVEKDHPSILGLYKFIRVRVNGRSKYFFADFDRSQHHNLLQLVEEKIGKTCELQAAGTIGVSDDLVKVWSDGSMTLKVGPAKDEAERMAKAFACQVKWRE